MSVQPLADYLAEHHKTHLIFDFDATLLLLHLPWQEWGLQMRDQLVALDPEPWRLWEKQGGLAGIQNHYVEKHGDKALSIIRDHNEHFEQRLSGFTLNEPLIKEVLALDPGHKKYIWSSNTRTVIERLLKETKLAAWFDQLVTRDDVRLIKPDPEGFQLIYDPNIAKECYVLIGDSSHDRGAAAAAGIDFYITDFFKLGI